MADFRDWIKTKDEEIRAGRGAAVRAELLSAVSEGKTEFRRAEKAAVAALCRRVGLYLPALRLLHPYLRPKAREPVVASAEEKLEYAGALVQAGAEGEGIRLLQQVDGNAHPNALLFQAFAHFSRWDYGLSLPLLRRYRAHPGLDVYAKQIAGVNLAAALVIERKYGEADNLLVKMFSELGNENALLRSNLWEISAQGAIYRRDMRQAEHCLNEAARLALVPSLFLEKWRAILMVLEDPKNLRPLEEVKKHAASLRHFETLRECDLYSSVATRDLALLHKTYFGTPFAAYRRRIEIESGEKITGATYDWQPAGKGKLRLNLVDNELKPGQVVDRTLTVLASDFYRPFHWVNLHAQLFPDRYLNPLSSPQVVHQAIKRSREWLSAHAPGVEIREFLGEYRLVFSGAGRIRVRATLPMSKEDHWLADLPKGEFASEEAANAWGTDKFGAIRRLNQLIAIGKIRRVKGGRSTRYQPL